MPSPGMPAALEAAMTQLCTVLEEIALVAIATAELLEPLIVLSGDGTAKDEIARGCRAVAHMMVRAVEQYLARCEALGLEERRRRSRLAARVGVVAA